MKLEELKKCIDAGVAPHELIIFIRDPENFLTKQYIQAICDANNLIRQNVNSLTEEDTAIGFVMDYSDTLKILDVEVFDEYLDDYSEITDTVVVCDKVDKKIKSKVDDYIIELPRLLEWQIKDYMKVLAPHMDKYDIDWLYTAAQGNIHRILNELDKINSFPPVEQKLAIEALKYEPGSDLFYINTFKVTDAILKGDKATLLELLLHRDSADVEFMGIVNNLLTKAKQILLAVYQRQGLTAADIGCSDKQLNFFIREYAHYPQGYLQYLISFLSEIDLKLKSGLLDMSKNAKLDYLITHLIA